MLLRDSIRRWLAAEQSSDEAAAEAALSEVFGGLRDPLAPQGFAEAILREIEARSAAAATLPASVRWAIAAAMVAAAVSFAYLPFVLQSLAEVVRVGSLVELVGGALVSGSGALVSWLELWQSLAELNRVLLSIASRPQVAVLLVGILAVSSLALMLLSRLTTPDRSREYA